MKNNEVFILQSIYDELKKMYAELIQETVFYDESKLDYLLQNHQPSTRLKTLHECYCHTHGVIPNPEVIALEWQHLEYRIATEISNIYKQKILIEKTNDRRKIAGYQGLIDISEKRLALIARQYKRPVGIQKLFVTQVLAKYIPYEL